MTTLYPSRIDGYSQIRVVKDTIGEIISRDHNDLRSAIISIEKTLGIDPQGTFSNVSERIDNINDLIIDHADGNNPRHNDTHLHSLKKVGNYRNISQGTTNSQIQDLLDYLNDFYSIGGAKLVGTEDFFTEKNNYKLSSNNAQDQIGEMGSILDQNIDYLNKCFSSYVVEGLVVSSSNFTDIEVDISSGVLSTRGMLIDSDEEDDLLLLSSPGDGTYYVYAERILNSIVFGAVEENDLQNILSETVVILAEVVLDSGTVTVFDMRRFGVFSNDKNGFTVGKAPVNGNDGYGCDFTSLKAAVKTVSLLGNSNKFIKNSKILLVGDIEISLDEESEIELPNNIEIDGCGNTITFSSNTSLFLIDAYNVTLKNIVVVPNFEQAYYTGNFASIAENTNVTNLTITDCCIKSSQNTSLDIEKFISIGNISGTTAVNKSIIRNNNVAIFDSGIYFKSSKSLLNNSIIEGNKFYQYDYRETVDGYGISVGSYCKVSNNIIEGGFYTGIFIQEGIYTDLNNNLIIGCKDTTYFMDNGILLKNSISEVSSSFIMNNIVRGVKIFGINSAFGDGYSSHVVIGNNIIDNKILEIEQPTNMTSIYCSNLCDSVVSNNIILYPGLSSYAIFGAKNILGNFIYCTPTPSETYDIFSIYLDDCPNAIVSQNVIFNCDGSGISIGSGCLGATITDNSIYNVFSETSFSISSYCIYANSSYVSVINNIILGSELNAINRKAIGCMGNKSIISGNAIHNLDSYGIISVGSKNVISNNILTEVKFGIDGYNMSNCVIRGNFILTDSSFDFISPNDAILNVGAGSLVDGNYIYGYGQETTNVMIDCANSENISVLNNVISSCVGIGIDCLGSEGCKINNNYIFSIYDGIRINSKSDVLNNLIFSSENCSIFVEGNYNLIASNGMYNSFGSCIYLDSIYDISVLKNYIYNPFNYGIYVNSVYRVNISENYIVSEREINKDGYLVFLNDVSNLMACHNTFVDKNIRNDGQFYNIYSIDSRSCNLNSNYICAGNNSYSYGIFIRQSVDFTINDNYIYNIERSAINVGTTDVLLGHGYLMGKNYIFKNNVLESCICVDEVADEILFFGNQVILINSGGNCFGFNVGDTSGRNILLSSNIISIDNGQKAVNFSGDGIKIIGNIAVGGISPNETYWGSVNWIERQIDGNFDKYWFGVSSDSDGSNLIACVYGGRIYTSSDGGNSWLERQPAGNYNYNWRSVASDSDGSNLIACVYNGRLYTSSDGGVNWIERQPEGDDDIYWRCVASDSDGSNLIVCSSSGGRINTSSDYGVNWIERQPAGDLGYNWRSVASDSDGSNLIACVYGGRLYTSSSGGNSWLERQPAGNDGYNWRSVASDSDGSNLIACIDGGRLYTSSDGGLSWTERQPAGDIDNDWMYVASNYDGSCLIVCVYGGTIYTSSDSGYSWAERQPAGVDNKNWSCVSSNSDGSSFIVCVYGGRLYTSSEGYINQSFDNVFV